LVSGKLDFSIAETFLKSTSIFLLILGLINPFVKTAYIERENTLYFYLYSFQRLLAQLVL